MSNHKLEPAGWLIKNGDIAELTVLLDLNERDSAILGTWLSHIPQFYREPDEGIVDFNGERYSRKELEKLLEVKFYDVQWKQLCTHFRNRGVERTQAPRDPDNG